MTSFMGLIVYAFPAVAMLFMSDGAGLRVGISIIYRFSTRVPVSCDECVSCPIVGCNRIMWEIHSAARLTQFWYRNEGNTDVREFVTGSSLVW